MGKLQPQGGADESTVIHSVSGQLTENWTFMNLPSLALPAGVGFPKWSSKSTGTVLFVSKRDVPFRRMITVPAGIFAVSDKFPAHHLSTNTSNRTSLPFGSTYIVRSTAACAAVQSNNTTACEKRIASKDMDPEELRKSSGRTQKPEST